MKGAGDEARELLERLRDDLRGLFRLRSEGHSTWIRGRTEGVRGADRVIGHAEAEGSDRIAATQRADELTDGPAPTTARVTRTPVTDLSHMTPLGDLYDRARRGDLDDNELGRELQGLERRYGPYHIKVLGAWHEKSQVDKDGNIHPENTGFNAQILDDNGEEAGSLGYSFGRDDDGKLVVTNDVTALEEGFTGKGFATAFSASTEDYFRRSGVDRIELKATRLRENDALDGAVAWAKAGYDWDPSPGKLGESVSNMRTRIESLLRGEIGPLSPGDTALLHDMRRRFNGPVADIPSPRELVMLAGDNPKLGEDLMKGSTWYGMKKL